MFSVSRYSVPFLREDNFALIHSFTLITVSSWQLLMPFVMLLWLQSQHHIQWETSHPQCPGWSHHPSRRQISSLTPCSCNNVTFVIMWTSCSVPSTIHEFLLPQSLTVGLIVHLHPRTDLHDADTSSLCLYLPQNPLLPHVAQRMCDQTA